MTTTETPAQRRYTGPMLDRIEVSEVNAEPFSDSELDCIDDFEQETAGISDSLDPPAAGQLPPGIDLRGAFNIYRAMFGYLRQWHDSIDSLRGELLLNGAQPGSWPRPTGSCYRRRASAADACTPRRAAPTGATTRNAAASTAT